MSNIATIINQDRINSVSPKLNKVSPEFKSNSQEDQNFAQYFDLDNDELNNDEEQQTSQEQLNSLVIDAMCGLM